MTMIKLDKSKCKKCNKCTYVCPLGIFTAEELSSPNIDPERMKFCIECGHCVAICDSNAISINDNSCGDCIEIQNRTSFNILSNLIQTRRSIRNYKDDIIPREDIEKLIQLTKWMPTAKNQCPVNWTVIHNPAKVYKLAEMVVKFFDENNILPEIVAAWGQGLDIINRGAPHLVLCHTKENAMMPVVDSTIAMTAFDLAASSMDLGTCWAGFFMMALKDDPKIAKECGIPDDEDIHTAIMLGKPKFNYKNIPNREPLNISWK
jgi:nitroreductase/NAD-dependent dihydropyrimidine dehydrogenase PreA subunit